MFRRILTVISHLSGILYLFVYISIFVPADLNESIVFANYLTPIFFLLNCFQVLYYIFNSKFLRVPVFSFVLGVIILFPLTISFHPFSKISGDFSVISFNIQRFGYAKRGDFSNESIRWIIDENSPIKCLQEFTVKHGVDTLNVIKELSKKGYNHFYVSTEKKNKKSNLGLVIFSIFPIVDSGVVFQKKGYANGAIYTDIKLLNDTIRIYNVHLESMPVSIRSIDKTIQALKKGSIERKKQIQEVLSHSSRCKYPTIIVGDFNEMPYNYNYLKLRNEFKNAFEEAGFGFGFTFRRIPFLRIDHQFYSNELRVTHHSVDYSIKISDHYPSYSSYKFTEN